MESRYLIIDIDRTIDNGFNMYWRNNDHGYTANINEAKIFNEIEALNIIERPNTTKRMIKLEAYRQEELG